MRPDCRAFNEVQTRHEIVKYKSSIIITNTGNRDLGTFDAIARVAPQQREYGYFTDSCFLSYPTACDRIVVLSMKYKLAMKL